MSIAHKYDQETLALLAQTCQSIIRRAPKVLEACENNVNLTFPTYSDSGDMTKQAKWKTIVEANNAVPSGPAATTIALILLQTPRLRARTCIHHPERRSPFSGTEDT